MAARTRTIFPEATTKNCEAIATGSISPTTQLLSATVAGDRTRYFKWELAHEQLFVAATQPDAALALHSLSDCSGERTVINK